MSQQNPLSSASGRTTLNGNELILKGLLESGVSLITGYPGSPLAEIFSLMAENHELLSELGVRAIQANNEAQAAAMLNGAQDARANAAAMWKSVGLHVAADALAVTNAAGTSPDAGSVVIVGDDPSLSSTQVAADSRWLFRHLQMPVIAPVAPQQLKDWLALAFEASRASGFVVGYWVTTEQAEGGGTVALRRNQRPRVSASRPRALDTAAIDPSRRVNIPPFSSLLERELLGPRRRALWKWIRTSVLDRIDAEREPTRVGVIGTGLAAAMLDEALDRLGLAGRVRVLRLGLVYPIDREVVSRFVPGLSDVYVVEEKGAFVEGQIREALAERADVRIWGKRFRSGAGFPETGGLTVDVVVERLLGESTWLALADPDAVARERDRLGFARSRPSAARRTPTFCPGCPHRETLSVLRDIDDRRATALAVGTAEVHGGTGGNDRLVFHGDIGCYSMAFLPPFRAMHNLSGMGLGGAAGAGADAFITNPQVVLMGDSTFFHTGLLTISNSIQAHQSVTYVILDNKNTAMTGHQSTAASESNLMGERVPPQEIERLVRALGPEVLVHRVHPSDREGYLALLERLVGRPGVKVVISDKECGITSARRRRRDERAEIAERGFLRREERIQIVEEACERCGACTTATGCPGLTLVPTPYGEKVAIERSTCVSDGYCTQVKACPSFEKVRIERVQPLTLPRVERPDASVRARPLEGAWRMVVMGIGGMGLGVLREVVVRAAERAGLEVGFFEKKGMAIRNGAVELHLTIGGRDEPVVGCVAGASADLLLGLEPLEGLRGLPRLGRRGTALVNTRRTYTVEMLVGELDYPAETEQRLLRDPSHVELWDVSTAAEESLGSSLCSNLVLLGVASQRGLLPLALEHLEDAIRDSFEGETAVSNLAAFELGRDLVVGDRRHDPFPAEPSLEESIARHTRSIEHAFLRPWVRRRESQAYRALASRARRDLAPVGSESLRRVLRHLGDLIEHSGAPLAIRYLEAVERVLESESHAYEPEGTRRAIEAMFRVLLVKDEIYVSHLLTRPEKLERDRRTFRLGPRDRIRYRHLNRPSFTLWGRDLEFEIETRDWMLRIVKHARFLRALLPGWHARERAFADWFESEVLASFVAGEFPTRAHALEALEVPFSVRGYRGIRYPAMAEARDRVARLKSGIRERQAAPDDALPAASSQAGLGAGESGRHQDRSAHAMTHK